ncbi:hypothetical protein PO909_029320, partial [Leuciscus waleckii]
VRRSFVLIRQKKVSKHRKLLVKQLRSTLLTVIKMAFIKEESEDFKIEETFTVKQEDTEEQTGWFHSQNSTEMNYIF